jgi:hypothetical protein
VNTLVVDQVVVPLELGCLPYSSRQTLADRPGKAGLQRLGPAVWQPSVRRIVPALLDGFAAVYFTVGGGNADKANPLPEGGRRAGNQDAFAGGFWLWEESVAPHDGPAACWRVVR